METLPPELIKIILSFCGKHCLIARRVCSIWKELSSQVSTVEFLDEYYNYCYELEIDPSSQILNYLNFEETEENVGYLIRKKCVGIFLYFVRKQEFIPVIAKNTSFEFIRSTEEELIYDSNLGYLLTEFLYLNANEFGIGDHFKILDFFDDNIIFSMRLFIETLISHKKYNLIERYVDMIKLYSLLIRSTNSEVFIKIHDIYRQKGKANISHTGNVAIFKKAMIEGNVEILECINKYHIYHGVHSEFFDVLPEVSEKGHLDVIVWSYKHHIPILPQVFEKAAEKGHLDILKWGEENHYTMNGSILAIAASKNHFGIVKWLQNLGKKYRFCETDIITIAKTCNLEMAKHLFSEEYDKSTRKLIYDTAFVYKNHEIIKWAFSHIKIMRSLNRH